MLFPAAHLDGIATGEVDLAFRRWPAPRVKPGARLRTRIGVLAIDAVDRVDPEAITDAQARRAGHADRAAVLAAMARREGDVYRIALRLDGPDPRVALRNRSELSDADRGELTRRLERLDAASRHGPWTQATLALIAAHPETRAIDLAEIVGREKLPFKRDVRKLKELGLTESLERGYRLSPRGRAWLDGGDR